MKLYQLELIYTPENEWFYRKTSIIVRLSAEYITILKTES